MDINKQQFVPFLYFCKNLFEKPYTTEKSDIAWKNFQDVTIEENVRADFPEDRKGIKVTFTVSNNFVREVGGQMIVLLEELRSLETTKFTGKVGKPGFIR